MKYSKQTTLVVAWYCQDCVRVCRFRRKKDKYTPVAFETLKITEQESTFDSLKKGLKRVSWHSGICLILSGALPDCTFFRTTGVRMSAKDQRNALDFELSNHLIHIPVNKQLQFVQEPLDETMVSLNVCVCPDAGFETLVRSLKHQKIKADEFLYPLLTLRKEDPPVYLPELDPDFYFTADSWTPAIPGSLPDLALWQSCLAPYFELDGVENFSLQEYLPCMLIARFIISGEMDRSCKEVRLLPSFLRISRYRQHLYLSIFLLLILFPLLIWNFASSAMDRYAAYASTNAEIKSLRNKTQKMTRQQKTMEKNQKELQKVLNIAPGEKDLLNLLMQISQIIPENVRVTRFQQTENDIRLEFQSAAVNMNFTEVLSPLKRWKVANVSQRQANNISIVNLTLVRNGGEK